MYFEPYLDRQTWSDFQREIEDEGFVADTELATRDRPVYGLNLAFAWPFPESLKKPYEKLEHTLSALGSDVYVYPHEETHVTVMTLVNFKNHPHPSETYLQEMKKVISTIVTRLEPLFSPSAEAPLKPFIIDVGPPVLSRHAALLPILNATGEVRRLRVAAPQFLSSVGLKELHVPQLLHSTILRFLEGPKDVKGFVTRFENSVKAIRLGKASIDAILLTAETKPYMRAGEVLHRFELSQ